jgi:hypothetical protein
MNSPSPLPPGSTAHAFFTDVVAPTVAEFLAAPGDLRRGCLAVMALAHMADHAFHAVARARPFRNDLEAFKARLASDSPCVGFMFEIANATKHVVRDSEGKTGFADLVVSNARFGLTPFGGRFGGPYVYVPAGGGTRWELDALVAEAADFWREWLRGAAGFD